MANVEISVSNGASDETRNAASSANNHNNVEDVGMAPNMYGGGAGDELVSQGLVHIANELSGILFTYIISKSGISHENHDLDIKTSLDVFQALSPHKEDGEYDIDEMIGQGTWFDRWAVEAGDVVDKYACDGVLPGGRCVELTDKW